jgi:ketopantoate reductase
VLGDVLARVVGFKPSHLVFVQNGWVRPFLADAAGSTRGLIWFTSKGEVFRVLRPSVFSGPAGGELAAALTRGGIPSMAVDGDSFRAAEAEKMGFNCVVGLPLAVHRVSLAEYLERHRDEAEAVFHEATSITAVALGVRPSPSWWGAFLLASQPIGWVRATAAKALEFRNGAVVRLAAESGLTAPVNDRLLRAAALR